MSKTNQTRYEVITQSTQEGDIVIPLPIPLLKKLGWKEGDNVSIGVDENGKLLLRKSD